LSLLKQAQARAVLAQKKAADAAAESRSAVAFYNNVKGKRPVVRKSLFQSTFGDDGDTSSGNPMPPLPKGPGALPGKSTIMSALQSAGPLSSTLNSAQQAVSQGQSIFNAASSAGGGDYGAVASAAQGLIGDLPLGQIGTLLEDVVGVYAGALSGLAMGETIGNIINIPPFTQVIGGEAGLIIGTGIAVIEEAWPILKRDGYNPFKFVGSLLGMVADIFTTPKTPQSDYRYLRDKICFPACNPNSPDGVVAGRQGFGASPAGNPRLAKNSAGYQMPTGPTSGPAGPFNFLITWPKLKGKSTANSRQAAMTLASYYNIAFSKRMGHTLTGQAWADTVAGTLLGSEPKAKIALGKLIAWYGPSEHFSTSMPYPSNNGVPPSTANTPANVDAVMAQNNAFPLDYLYYPVPTNWTGKTMQPCAHASETDVMMSADTLQLMLAEMAILNFTSLAVFHRVLQYAHFWHQASLIDAKKDPGLSPRHHPNLMRVLGYTSAAVRRDLAASKLAASKSQGKLLTTKGKSATVGSRVTGQAGSHSLARKKNTFWGWLLGLGAVSGIALWSRRK
jgi:hypothetical protein